MEAKLELLFFCLGLLLVQVTCVPTFNAGKWFRDRFRRPRSSESSLTAHEFHIISYNDVYVMEPTLEGGHYKGGPSRASYFIKNFRRQHPHTLVVFAGDTISPSLWSVLFKGQQMIEAHNIMGCDYAALGNHEFDWGRNGFVEVAKHSKFKWLNANAFEVDVNGTRTNRLLEHTQFNDIVVVNGVKIGLFGVLYDLKDDKSGVYWTNPITAAQKQVYALKERGAEFIVAITHQSWQDDNAFSSKVQGIDLILGGHDHRAMMQSDFGTPYIKADNDFKNIWVTDVQFFKENKRKPLISFKNIPITEDMKKDPLMEQTIDDYRHQVQAQFSKKIGHLCRDIDMTNPVIRTRESPITNFGADSHRTIYPHMQVDAAVMNGGGIRANAVFPKGDLTFASVLVWFPFDNDVLILNISGQTLRNFIVASNAISCSAPRVVALNGWMVVPSGFKYEFQCAASGEGEVTLLEWDGKEKKGPISPTERIVFGINDQWVNQFQHVFDEGDDTQSLVEEKDAIAISVAIRQAIVSNEGNVCPELEQRFIIHPSV